MRQPGDSNRCDTVSIAADISVVDGAVVLRGDLLIGVIDRIDWARLSGTNAATIDLTALARLDTAGAWAIISLERDLSRSGRDVAILGASPLHRDLLDMLRRHMPQGATQTAPPYSILDSLERVGRGTAGALRTALLIVGFLGQIVITTTRLIFHPSQIRWTATVHHMQQVGLNAVPIVALMAFLIGVVLAFQGAEQLRQFGAEVFVVDLIAISILRELGILLTAIIVAGRSGSAFTAAIGSMKMREEIDAMRTLGLDPVTVLVVPRVMALILMLPVLGVIANVAGLVGGALMSWIELGVSPGVFQSRFVSNTDVWHFGVGLIKAPFFALIIGVVGCFQGMQVGGDAESLGQMTSLSVVLSIFLVITADAMFSIFFAIVGV